MSPNIFCSCGDIEILCPFADMDSTSVSSSLKLIRLFLIPQSFVTVGAESDSRRFLAFSLI